MIGLPDEYYTLEYNGNPTAASYQGAGFTTNSIMNHTGAAGMIHEWHYKPIEKQYRQWKGLGFDKQTAIVMS